MAANGVSRWRCGKRHTWPWFPSGNASSDFTSMAVYGGRKRHRRRSCRFRRNIESACNDPRPTVSAAQITEVRISKVARYDKDFTPAKRFEPDADTLALYHFDEGSGDVLKDSSGNGHHGKIVGAKWVKADGSPISRVRQVSPRLCAFSLPR